MPFQQHVNTELNTVTLKHITVDLKNLRPTCLALFAASGTTSTRVAGKWCRKNLMICPLAQVERCLDPYSWEKLCLFTNHTSTLPKLEIKLLSVGPNIYHKMNINSVC